MLAWDWPVFHVMTLYWAENVVAGIVTLLRMLHAHPLGGLFMGAFFCVHYGMFCYVHGLFVNGLFNAEQVRDFSPMPLLHTLATTPTLITTVVLLTASHLWSFVAHPASGSPGTAQLAQIMQRPYKRMAALHIGLIFGGWVIMGLGNPVLALVPLIVIKTAIDLGLHKRANVPRTWLLPSERANP